MTYYVEDLPPGAQAAAFAPIPPPGVTNPASSSWGLISSREVGLLNTISPSPPAAAIPPVSFDPATQPGQHISGWSPVIYIALPAVGFCRQVPLRHNEELPIPAVTPNAGQQAQVAQRRPSLLGRRQIPWPRAFQRFPPVTNAS